ncbi:putative protein serine/threonine kinase [Tieghemostelium lacteum]|uniref:Serine/threonine-protein kinase PLK n=1 Tax=Tieghemostelium lacteum TaxID=361077 RepID=A0A151Z820_TIELA|nr:putative protein serine/threonine kinase [Tieghemostelium lacteum]|eukprot:KYQ90116.1 putative protein serine/threonine kinase [Tieghemostelium lacteum]
MISSINPNINNNTTSGKTLLQNISSPTSTNGNSNFQNPLSMNRLANLNDQENIVNNYQNNNCNPTLTKPTITTTTTNNIPQGSSLITQSMTINRPLTESRTPSSSQEQQPTEEIIVKEVINNNIVKTYKQGEFLGKGGFAKCYLMTEIETNKVYAAKIIPKSSLVKSRARAKLKSEIKIHSSLSHENIVKFEHCFENEENVYILLGLCNQKTVMDIHKKRKYIHEYEAKYYLYQVIMAVKYLHAQKIIHRDLKLGNLFIDQMRIKLGDFGLSTKIEHDGERKKTICGTPNYIAPEILDNGNGHSYEVDIWSIGIILYTLLIGKPPFETPDVKNTYQRIRKNQYTFPPEPIISPSAKSLIISILNPVPEKRPNLNQILEHDFFLLSTIPKTLPVSSLTTAPAIRPLTEKTGSILNISSPQRPQQQPPQYQQTTTTASSLSPQKKQLNNPLATLSPNSQQKLSELDKEDIHFRKLRRLERIKENDQKTKILKQQLTDTANTGQAQQQTQNNEFLQQYMKSLPKSATGSLNEQPQNRGTDQLRDLESKIANNHIRENEDCIMSDVVNNNGGDGQYSNEIPSSLVYILQYTDLTAKYGIGYMLSNGFVGSYFNDSTKIISYMDSGVAHYMEHAKGTHGDGRRILNIFENHPHDTQKKVTLIKYFSNQLHQQLSPLQINFLNDIYTQNRQSKEPVNNNSNNNFSNQHNNHLSNPIYVKKWLRTPSGMGFRLSDKTTQVIFPDKSIIIITKDQMVTYISPQNTSKTAKLSYFLNLDDAKILNRIKYTRDLLCQLYSKKPNSQNMISSNSPSTTTTTTTTITSTTVSSSTTKF